jgi:hypothetical protein
MEILYYNLERVLLAVLVHISKKRILSVTVLN